LLIEEYGPEIVYLPGKKNILADALSRLPSSNNNPDIPEANLRIKEFFVMEAGGVVTDPECPVAFSVLAQAQQDDAMLAEATNHPGYTQRMFGPHSLVLYQEKIVIPATLQDRVIQWYHEILCHPGIKRTEFTIRQNFTWSTLAHTRRSKIRLYVRYLSALQDKSAQVWPRTS
jgi:hypothetical protein